MQAKPDILAIDLTSLIRLVYSKPDETGRTVTQRVFARLADLIEKYEPTAVFCAVDSDTSWRHGVRPGYRTRRESYAGPDLDFRRVGELLEEIGCLSNIRGMESGDILASIAFQAVAASSLETVVVTTWSWCAQIPCPNPEGIHSWIAHPDGEPINAEGVREKWGVDPTQIPAMIAIAGDSDRKLEGSPRCGVKTAARVIGPHRTLGDVFEPDNLSTLHTIPRVSKPAVAGLVASQEQVLENAKVTTFRINTSPIRIGSSEVGTLARRIRAAVGIDAEGDRVPPDHVTQPPPPSDPDSPKEGATDGPEGLEDGLEQEEGSEAKDGLTPEPDPISPPVPGADRQAVIASRDTSQPATPAPDLGAGSELDDSGRWLSDVDEKFWHPSHFTTFGLCEMAFFYQYLERRWSSSSIHSARGLAVHEATKKINRRKMKDEPIEKSEVSDIVASEFDRRRKWLDLDAPGSGVRRDHVREYGQRLIEDTYKDSAIALAVMYLERHAPTVEPIEVERYFRVTLKGREWGFGGTIDCRTRTGIEDTKTKRTRIKQIDADQSIQLTIYTIADRLKRGRMPDHVSLVGLTETDSGGRKYDVMTSTRGPEECRAALIRGDIMTDRVQSGVFMPTTPDSWKCCRKWCGHYEVCPFGARGRSKQAMRKS